MRYISGPVAYSFAVQGCVGQLGWGRGVCATGKDQTSGFVAYKGSWPAKLRLTCCAGRCRDSAENSSRRASGRHRRGLRVLAELLVQVRLVRRGWGAKTRALPDGKIAGVTADIRHEFRVWVRELSF